MNLFTHIIAFSLGAALVFLVMKKDGSTITIKNGDFMVQVQQLAAINQCRNGGKCE